MKKILTSNQTIDLIAILKARFENNMNRHQNIFWDDVQARLEINLEKLWSINEMEKTGGEPDVVQYDSNLNEYHFYDCCLESPKDRRSLCYDTKALDSRKENKPKNSALGMANDMGIYILNENEYYELQKFGNFDTKTSSWLATPLDIREKGGSIFGDWRYGKVFVYHNGAESYYAGRGFRGVLKI